VVVSVGDTVIEPLVGTLPIPLSITAETASVEVHERVEGSPTWMVSGMMQGTEFKSTLFTILGFLSET
jgi:hypothetical protein